jgi:hypothetical protein
MPVLLLLTSLSEPVSIKAEQKSTSPTVIAATIAQYTP